MDLAPIVLFVYNRPQHTRQTLEALSTNWLFDQSELIVYADGLKAGASEEDLENIRKVRSIVEEKSWCKSVKIIVSETNKGLAKSIVSGVTEVIKQYGKIIVLEDDVVTSPGFLKYMNEALDLYEKEEQVMHISGYMFPVKGKLPSTFFYTTASCWGWATWKNRWEFFRADATSLFREIYSSNRLKEFDLDHTADFGRQLQSNISGEKETWAVKWYASMFLRNGLALHPYPSLTNNTGHDLSGENCKPTQLFHWDQLADEIPVSKIRLEESVRARQLMRNFYRRIHFPAKNSKYHRRKLIPLSFRNAVKLISDPDTRQNHFASVKKESEIQRIKAIPRYIKDQTSLLGFPLTFNDPASFLFMYREIFEKEVYYFPTENTHPFIIDCGSNIGLSLIYFKKIYPEATILGFEPDPEAFQTLQENISQSGVNGVELFNKGIWDCNTTLDFRTEGADGGRVATGTDSRNLVRIETVRLKEILDNKNIDLLKLDIEGAEFRVLLDCREQLHDVKRIFVEYHSFPGEPQELGSILQILKDAGFRYYLSNPGLTSENPFDKVVTDASMDMQFNIYGIRTK